MKFLGRAKKILRGMAEPSKSRVQHFNVRCPAGHQIRGERTLGYQALRCPGCGEGVFVLPLSPLPEPAGSSRPRPSRPVAAVSLPIDEGPIGLADVPFGAEYSSGRGPGAVDAEIIWDDTDTDSEPVESETSETPVVPPKPDTLDPPRPKKQRPKSGSSTTDQASSRIRKPVASANPVTAPTDPRLSGKKPHQRSRRSRRRPILIFLAVAFLVLGTLGLRFWRNRRKELPGIYDQGRTEGLAALDAGSFDKAHQLLSAAKAAVESLGGDLEGAEAVRQGADEAAIFVDLLPETLEVLLDEAGRMDPHDWENRFAAYYAGHSILIDANILATPETEGQTEYEIDYLILPPGGPSQFRDAGAFEPARYGKIVLTDFELLLLAHPKVGAHVIFGAKLASFRFDPTTEKTWTIRLQPKSGTFITHARSLETVGWPSESIPAEKPAEAER